MSAVSAATSARPPTSTCFPTAPRFLATSADATQPGKPLTDDYLRPYQGYASTKWLAFDGNSSYHSLQIQAQRRFSRSLHFGVAYTWSKAMAYSDGDQGTVSTFVSRREFIGTPEQFDKLDRNGDGLISPEEAAAATPAEGKSP